MTPYNPSLPPQDIIDAAFKVSQWMEQHNQTYWQLGNVCDRRFAYRLEVTKKSYIRHRTGEVEQRMIDMGWKE